MRAWGRFFALTLVAGCAPLSVQQGARTVRPGETQVGMSVGAARSSDEDDFEKSSQTAIAMTPNAWVRRGLHERVDVGAQFFPGGTRLDMKGAIVKTDQVALGAGAGASLIYYRSDSETSDQSNTSFFGDVGVYATFGFGSTDLNVCARGLIGQQKNKFTDEDGTITSSSDLTGFGGAIGVTFRRGDVGIQPEIAVYQLTSEYEDGFESEALAIVPSIGFTVGF